MLIIHIAFLLTGVVTTMLGPMLPFLIPHWGLTDAQAGQLFIAQFTGGFCGSLVAGQLMAKFGSRWSMVMGLALAAVGVVLLWSANHALGIAALFVYGSAMGITAPATNMLVAQAAPEKSAAALNLLNFSWTAGAMMGTPAVSWLLLHKIDPSHVTYAIAVALIAAAAVVGLRRWRDGAVTQSKAAPPKGSWSLPLVVVLAIPIMFLYVGVENGVAGWLPTFCTRVFGEHAWLIATAQAVFWGALLAGRLFAPLVLRRISPGSVITLALATALTGTVLVLVSPGPLVLLPGVALTGLGLAAVLPTTVSQVTRFDPLAAGRFAGIMFAFAGLGGASIPSLVGFISGRSGSLRTGLTVAVFAIIVMLVVNLRISRLVVPVRARATGV
jgi:FHS family glucose/mannose:H+ symporter-like MFS transporter